MWRNNVSDCFKIDCMALRNGTRNGIPSLHSWKLYSSSPIIRNIRRVMVDLDEITYSAANVEEICM